MVFRWGFTVCQSMHQSLKVHVCSHFVKFTRSIYHRCRMTYIVSMCCKTRKNLTRTRFSYKSTSGLISVKRLGEKANLNVYESKLVFDSFLFTSSCILLYLKVSKFIEMLHSYITSSLYIHYTNLTHLKCVLNTTCTCEISWFIGTWRGRNINKYFVYILCLENFSIIQRFAD